MWLFVGGFFTGVLATCLAVGAWLVVMDRRGRQDDDYPNEYE